ncbi:MAG: hypothetical protein NWF05_11670 [Candidatus Bathyarchaeota archaeon]|nr:hypothetical protein [Candidatus Bathyarchaeota archaeon]
MAHVTVEYMILVPMLILQIFLFPFAVGWVMDTWVDSRRELVLEETASHLGGSLQQVYLALNHQTIQSATLTNRLDIPLLIDGKAYTGNVTWHQAVDFEVDSNRILDVTLTLSGSGLSATASVTLGSNVEWQNSTFLSSSTTVCIIAQKFSNGTINLSFGA